MHRLKVTRWLNLKLGRGIIFSVVNLATEPRSKRGTKFLRGESLENPVLLWRGNQMAANISQRTGFIGFLFPCYRSLHRTYITSMENERERECIMRTQLCSVVVHRGERIISSRQVRNPRVFTALSSLLYDAYHATIEQMRCGYVLVVTRWGRFKEHSRVEFFKIF